MRLFWVDLVWGLWWYDCSICMIIIKLLLMVCFWFEEK